MNSSSYRYRRRRRRRGGEQGAVSVELAVIFPAVLLLILAAVQAGLVFHARHLAQAAAQEALRATRQYDGSTGAGRQAATGLLSRDAGDLLVARTISIGRSPTQADVRISGHALSLLPGVTLTVTAHAAGPVERFTTDGGGP
jgi:Flp pilus assembly protein TadG